MYLYTIIQLGLKFITNADDFTVIYLQDSKINFYATAHLGSMAIDIKKPESAGDKRVKLIKHISIQTTKTLLNQGNSNNKH